MDATAHYFGDLGFDIKYILYQECWVGPWGK